jgi:hypothetical protein
MKKLTRTWTLPCSAARYWDIFSDEAYSRALYLEGLRFKDFRVLAGDPSARRLYLSPRINAPGPVQKLMGDSFAYEQHGRLDRAAGLWSWKMVHPGGKKGMVSSEGTIRVIDAGAGQCTRSDEVTITGNVFGVGGLIESAAESELKSSWDAELAFFKTWLAAHTQETA